MLKRKLCSGMVARGTIDCSRLRVNGGIQRLAGQLTGDTGVILYAVSGMWQVRESGSARRWDERGKWHSGFKTLILPQGLAAHLGDGMDLPPSRSKAWSLSVNLPVRACWTSRKVCSVFDTLRGQSYRDRVGSCLPLSSRRTGCPRVQMLALRPGSPLHSVGFAALWRKASFTEALHL